MHPFYRQLSRILPVALLGLAACGKPEAGGGGPPDDFKVQAVIAPVEPLRLEEQIRLVGTLQARDIVQVVSEINAAVVELAFEEGRPVSAGDVLVRLDDRKLAARVQDAEARLTLARTNLERGRELRASETISAQEYDRAQAEYEIATAAHALAQAELDDTVIKAPFDGVVSERHVSIGQFVTAGQPLTVLVRHDPLEAAFHVPERYLSQLNVDQTVNITTTAYPDETFTGRVFFIDPRVDEASRTIRVKAAVSNADGLLKPGMFAALNLVLHANEDALLIPEAAIQYRGDEALVFVMTEDGVADMRMVSVGARRADTVQITSGLNAGDRVVVEGYQKMFPGVGILISPDSARYGITPGPATDDAAAL